MNSVSFYANTTIYIVAALIATAGALDSLVNFAAGLPFAGRQSRLLVEAKIFLLITARRRRRSPEPRLALEGFVEHSRDRVRARVGLRASDGLKHPDRPGRRLHREGRGMVGGRHPNVEAGRNSDGARLRINMARRTRIERATCPLGGDCSIH